MRTRHVALALLLLATPNATTQEDPAPAFRAARPVWPASLDGEKNRTVGFRAVFDARRGEPLQLALTAASLYRATCNGAFVGHGPARTAHGFARVDAWDLGPHLRDGTNVVAVEVAGYAANSYSLVDDAPFLRAEIADGARVVAATGAGFAARLCDERVQRVQRQSFQRPFSEVYRLTPGFDRWRTDPDVGLPELALAERPDAILLPRRVPYPEFRARAPQARVASGTLETGVAVERPWKDRALTAIGPQLGGFPEAELATIPSLELQTIATATRVAVDAPYRPTQPLPLAAGTFQILDFGCDLTGFVGLSIVCRERARVFLCFDELLRDGDVDWKRLGCVNVIALELAPGEYAFESIEPNTMRYLKVLALDGDCDVRAVHLREYVNPDATRAAFACSDPRLGRIFTAARETFRQNAVDIFMDCPSRERAGWLCDSFFTARVAFDLCGDTRVERSFLENFLLPERFEHIPDGMLPMCFPADHDDGVFIPNWAMWFVLELEEYAARGGDRGLVQALRPRVLALLAYLRGFRNEDGLLERLPSWVFVEWSKANEFVQDVSYPSNMLWARALAAAGALYGMPELAAEAEQVRAAIRAQSFDGEFFVDNAVRRDGTLAVTRNRSEVCQYLAFFLGTATPASHPELWRRLCDDFGPHRTAWPEVWPANAFVGNVVRLELLSAAGRGRQLLGESIDYLLYMADRTGTLWENAGDYASCNHGFASHAAHVLLRDVLGLAEVDAVERRVRVRIGDVGLDWCEGARPVPDGSVALRWWREGEDLWYRVAAPDGWAVDVENASGRELRRGE